MNFLKNLGNALMRSMAIRYLNNISKQHVAAYPRLAVLSFDHIGHHINVFGRYERPELELLKNVVAQLPQRRTALDLGANIGNHTLLFSELFNRVHAFEPNEELFPLLRYNTRQHPKVVVHPFGASSSNASAEARIPSDNVGAGRLGHPTEGSAGATTRFELRRLDDFNELANEHIDFVKLDIEGHELEAIDGMTTLIERNQPLIAIEQNAEQVAHGTTPAIERLRSLGYDYLYEIVAGSSRVPQSLPAFVQAPLRLLEGGFHDVYEIARLTEVHTLEKRFYGMLLASHRPLQAGVGQHPR